jgi:hypothetical protein
MTELLIPPAHPELKENPLVIVGRVYFLTATNGFKGNEGIRVIEGHDLERSREERLQLELEKSEIAETALNFLFGRKQNGDVDVAPAVGFTVGMGAEEVDSVQTEVSKDSLRPGVGENGQNICHVLA